MDNSCISCRDDEIPFSGRLRGQSCQVGRIEWL
jgi:hypothetical protein